MSDSFASNDTVVELVGVGVEHADPDGRPVTALDDISLSIRRGERVAVLGSSGSGKSSLLDVLGGRVQPAHGAVRVFDDDPFVALRSRRRRTFGRRVGMVRQHGDLVLSLRAIHNVNAGLLGTWSTWAALASLIRPSGRSRVREILERVALADRMDAVTGDLSGGERQRVAVARVLRQAPDLLLADEPTSSVDPRLADSVMAALTASSTTTLVTAVHDPALAQRHVTRMIGLRAGHVVFDADPTAVSTDMLDRLYASNAAAADA
ncbi:MAG: ATP-binding cassette domain-containing protein [Actinomycetota bacterium]